MPPYALSGLLLLAGTLLGSFLNVLILRYHSGRGIVWERSECPACRQTLRWWELIPVVSYLLLRGRCARCRGRISLQYPLIEIVTGLVVVMLLSPWPGSVGLLGEGLLLLLIASILIVLGMIDLYTFLLPDVYILLLLAAVGIFRWWRGTLVSLELVYGAMIGVGFLLLLWLLTRGQGIGLGDVKLMLPLGMFFGVGGTVTLLFGAFCAGGLVGLLLLLRGRASMKTPVPFGPFLTATAILLVLWPRLPERFLFFLFGY